MWLTWLVKDRIAACGRPLPGELDEAGVRAIVSLTVRPPADGDLPKDALRLHLPVPDMTAPSKEQLATAVAFLRQCEREGLVTAVHCGAGLGRTGTVLACYLVSVGARPEEAMREVRRARPGSIETPEQEEAVRAFRWKKEERDG